MDSATRRGYVEQIPARRCRSHNHHRRFGGVRVRCHQDFSPTVQGDAGAVVLTPTTCRVHGGAGSTDPAPPPTLHLYTLVYTNVYKTVHNNT